MGGKWKPPLQHVTWSLAVRYSKVSKRIAEDLQFRPALHCFTSQEKDQNAPGCHIYNLNGRVSGALFSILCILVLHISSTTAIWMQVTLMHTNARVLEEKQLCNLFATSRRSASQDESGFRFYVVQHCASFCACFVAQGYYLSALLICQSLESDANSPQFAWTCSYVSQRNSTSLPLFVWKANHLLRARRVKIMLTCGTGYTGKSATLLCALSSAVTITQKKIRRQTLLRRKKWPLSQSSHGIFWKVRSNKTGLIPIMTDVPRPIFGWLRIMPFGEWCIGSFVEFQQPFGTCQTGGFPMICGFP